MEYPAKMVTRAKQLWLETQDGKHRTFAQVAELINKEFSADVTRQAVQQWHKTMGWALASKEPLQQEALAVAMTPVPLPMALSERDPDLEEAWEWETRKLKFLTTLAGLAEDCFSVARRPDANGNRLEFRDAESALKTGMTAMELIGKVNSGKFDDVAAGDRVPAMSEDTVKGVVAFFINMQAPTPAVSPVKTVEGHVDCPCWASGSFVRVEGCSTHPWDM